jgi:hypothetical protein
VTQERILKIQYTIYGDFLKKLRKLSHKYSKNEVETANFAFWKGFKFEASFP